MHTEEEYNNENPYEEFNYNNIDSPTPEPLANNNKRNKYIIIIIVLLVVLGMLIFLVIKSISSDKTDIQDKPEISMILDSETLELKDGENKLINATIINADNNVIINWFSSDESILKVDDKGHITALKEGKASVIATYIDKSNHTYEKKCDVTVIKAEIKVPIDNTKPVIKYTMSAKNNEWTNKNVEIKVNVTDNIEVSNIKYALNCVSNCTYNNINNNSAININSEGTTIVYIVATDKSNNTQTEQITIKIDKKSPTIKLNIKESIVYSNQNSVEVCATCQDKESGCSKEKECKSFNNNQNNVSIELMDKSGNKSTSTPFNIIFDTKKPTCNLIVNSTGNLTATYKDEGSSGISYFGYNSSYTGEKGTTKQIDSASTYYYYVKDKANNTNTCSINVKKGSNNCRCPNGYESKPEFTTTGCFKYLNESTWGDWIVSGKTVVKNGDVSTCNSSTASTCTEYVKDDNCAIDESGICYVKTTYTRTKVCQTGQLRGSSCYDYRYKNCDTYFYSN